jgi:sigma-B regulation protein RsbU (phosphoserine phosphatase)
MGKGPAAALFAGTLRTLLRALVGPAFRPADALNELNELMFDQLADAATFITVQLAVADLHHRELHVANAGHCPLLISSPHHGARAVAPDGMPLGISPEPQFKAESVAIEPFASVLFYTDGVTEARNVSGSFFGQSRLEWWLGEAVERSSTAEQLKRSLLLELASFQGGTCATDDQTFVILADETPRPVGHPPRDGSRWFLPWTLPGALRSAYSRR